jgi:hypothetical protein
VTGLLVVVLTIKQVIVALEGSFSPEYVVWFRSLGAAAILHLVFARVPVRTQLVSVDERRPAASPFERSAPVNTFPNLLR